MKTYLLTLSIVITLLSCKKDEKSVLAGCCGNPAIDEPVGNGHIYLPNIFTPNDDGINDWIFVLGDSIQLVKIYEIRNKDGVLVFKLTDLQPNDPHAGWDGKVNGIAKKGLYSVRLEVLSEDGNFEILEGEVCNYPCDYMPLENEPITLSDCQFPSQSNTGRFNPTIPTGEDPQCFE